MTLTFAVRNQTITYVDTKATPRIGSSNYLQLRFIYTSRDWDTLRKTLHISSGEYSEPFVLESTVFDVPEYYTQQSTFSITLMGDSGQVIVPTNVVTVTLDESNNLWTSTPPDAQNSAYITLLNSLGSLEDLKTETKENIVDAINETHRALAELEAPDWAQNDAAKKDYIKNRTHWVDDDGTVHKLDAKFLPAGGGGGTDDHQQLINRDAADAHPISSITGLNDKLTKLKPFIISVTYVDATTYLSDKTFTQILTAYNAGQQISAEIANYPNMLSPITLALTMHNGSLFVFSGTITDGNGHKVISAYVHDTDVWAVTLDTLTDGKDGITPTIGDNGNWYLGTTDTGKPSRGAKGDTGDTGAPGKDGAGMDVTDATVGQIAKISAVDSDGKPTGWEPVDMPSGGGGGSLRWQKINSLTLAEQTNEIIIDKDTNGVAIADYDAVAMKVEFDVPADSTQTDNNGTPWIYPNALQDSSFRVIASVASWKTVNRRCVIVFIGDIDGIAAVGNQNMQLVPDPAIKPYLTVMDAVRLFISNNNNHWPVGTAVSVEVLSERT